jgi:hypothetical protein
VKGAAAVLAQEAQTVQKVQARQTQINTQLTDNLKLLADAVEERDDATMVAIADVKMSTIVLSIYADFKALTEELTSAYQDFELREEEINKIRMHVAQEVKTARIPDMPRDQLRRLTTTRRYMQKTLWIEIDLPLVRSENYQLLQTIPMPDEDLTKMPDMQPSRVIVSQNLDTYMMWADVDNFERLSERLIIVRESIFSKRTEKNTM